MYLQRGHREVVVVVGGGGGGVGGGRAKGVGRSLE